MPGSGLASTVWILPLPFTGVSDSKPREVISKVKTCRNRQPVLQWEGLLSSAWPIFQAHTTLFPAPLWPPGQHPFYWFLPCDLGIFPSPSVLIQILNNLFIHRCLSHTNPSFAFWTMTSLRKLTAGKAWGAGHWPGNAGLLGSLVSPGAISAHLAGINFSSWEWHLPQRFPLPPSWAHTWPWLSHKRTMELPPPALGLWVLQPRLALVITLGMIQRKFLVKWITIATFSSYPACKWGSGEVRFSTAPDQPTSSEPCVDWIPDALKQPRKVSPPVHRTWPDLLEPSDATAR